MCMTYFILLQKITVIVFLLIFFAGRFFWSFIKGKRVKTNVSNGIVNGRFWITLVVYVLLPLLFIFNLFVFLYNIIFFSQPTSVFLFFFFNTQSPLTSFWFFFFFNIKKQKQERTLEIKSF